MHLVHQSSRNTEVKQIAQDIFHQGKEKRISLCSRIDNPSGSSFGEKKRSLRKVFTYCTSYKVLISRGFSLKMEKINPQGNLILLQRKHFI